MLFANLTIRLLASDPFPPTAKQRATIDLTTTAHKGALSIPIGEPVPPDQIAEAHDHVDAGTRQRVPWQSPARQAVICSVPDRCFDQ